MRASSVPTSIGCDRAPRTPEAPIGSRRRGLLFFSFLAGLFAKTFVEKLRVTFDTLAGT